MPRGARTSPASWIVLLLLASSVLAPAARAATPERFPAAGELRWWKVRVRAEPSARARVVHVLRQLRPDFRRQFVLARAATRDARGRLWLRIDVPLRPNGRVGWIPARAAKVAPVRARIVIHRAARRLEVWRRGGRVFRTVVAVGRPRSPTPLGSFYVTAGFKATRALYGAYAFETSAYSNLSDWPGGGVVGIHGTNRPDLLGRAVSHGCVRVSNSAVLRLKRLVGVGTPVEILA